MVYTLFSLMFKVFFVAAAAYLLRRSRLGEGENEEAHKQNRFHGFRTNSVHSFAS